MSFIRSILNTNCTYSRLVSQYLYVTLYMFCCIYQESLFTDTVEEVTALLATVLTEDIVTTDVTTAPTGRGREIATESEREAPRDTGRGAEAGSGRQSIGSITRTETDTGTGRGIETGSKL